VAVGPVFEVYINGELSGTFEDDALASGHVQWFAGTYEDSDETWCEFTDSWVWALGTGADPDRSGFSLDPAGLPAHVEAGLTAAEITLEDGRLVAEDDEVIIDLSDDDNTFRRVSFDGTYADFVAGVTIAWGPGAPEDQCGFLFRASDDGLYNVWISREGDLGFDMRVDGEWRFDTGTDDGQLDTGANARNDLMIVAIDDIFNVYINGEYVDFFRDDAFTEGAIALMGATFEGSDETYCTFTDAWVWEFE
jgi:hypothetical protein